MLMKESVYICAGEWLRMGEEREGEKEKREAQGRQREWQKRGGKVSGR